MNKENVYHFLQSTLKKKIKMNLVTIHYLNYLIKLIIYIIYYSNIFIVFFQYF
jgi:hypothetical protein